MNDEEKALEAGLKCDPTKGMYRRDKIECSTCTGRELCKIFAVYLGIRSVQYVEMIPEDED